MSVNFSCVFGISHDVPEPQPGEQVLHMSHRSIIFVMGSTVSGARPKPNYYDPKTGHARQPPLRRRDFLTRFDFPMGSLDVGETLATGTKPPPSWATASSTAFSGMRIQRPSCNVMAPVEDIKAGFFYDKLEGP
ncbi:hypothetical protein PG997_011468 [Apiospora hydei]|uniref:Uncharacterized protein n=1 Tax=Apiospora hydei TaxID=1337664 RepID=A0ABR1VJ72_9PEZI